MLSNRAIASEIEDLKAFRQLVKAYGEIASTRMKSSRQEVLTARQFLASVQEIFDEVRRGYAKRIAELAEKKGGKEGEGITFLGNNGRTVAVFLGSNTGLYGELVSQVFNRFLTDIEKTGAEATIVGKYGLSLFLQTKPDKSYTFFELPDHGSFDEELADIIKHVVSYKEMHVYFGKFNNMVSQIPETLVLSAETPVEDYKTSKRTNYLFEPELERILQFFEAEIFGSIFNQTIGESRLAKFASRIIAMDRAEENIKDNLKKMNIAHLKATHHEINKKQLNSITSTFYRRHNGS